MSSSPDPGVGPGLTVASARSIASSSGIDHWWRELGTTALLGTSRRAVPPLPEPALARLGISPGERTGVGAEEQLLDAAALGSALRRCGTTLRPAQVPDRARPETRPLAPPRAAQLLELVLGQPPAGAGQRTMLLVHWLNCAAALGCRVPATLLPRLLDLATADRELRAGTAAVIGERGRWLAGLRRPWRWAAEHHGSEAGLDGNGAAPAASATPVVTPEAWALLSSAERLPVLLTLRRVDPDAARELVLSSWHTDSARIRRDQLDGLRAGLGPSDEPLLEQALDDRAGTVRELAVELLEQLPGSARAARMADRLRPLVSRKGLLGRSVEIALPDDPDPSGVRDGLVLPSGQRSARGWWLEQICAGAPLKAWGELTRADPATALRRIDEPDAVLGLVRAARAQRNAAWAAALLPVHWDASLLAVLPTAERERAVLGFFETTDNGFSIEAALRRLDQPWSAAFSRQLLARLRAAKDAETVVGMIMTLLAGGLHEASLADLEAWRIDVQTGQSTSASRRLATNLRNLVQLHSVRRSMTEAFS